MNTSDDRRRGAAAGREGQNQGEQRARPRRAPLFSLEADDFAPTARPGPPAPLADLLSDLDEVMPAPAPPRRVPQRAPQPPRPVEPARERSSGAPQQRTQPLAQPQRASATQPSRPQAVTQTATRPRQELRPAPLAVPRDEPRSAIELAQARYQSIDGDLARLELANARPRPGLSYVPPAAPAPQSLNTIVMLGMICLASLLVLFTLGGGGSAAMSRWMPLIVGDNAANIAQTALFAAARPAGDYTLKGPPSLTPQQIDRILEEYGSPAAGTGEDWYRLGVQYGIDPAFAVAFFIHESGAGANPAWAGIKAGGGTTHNVGNIICAGYATCYGRFRDYGSWSEGIEDWYRLIDVEYIQGRGHRTVADIIPVYAPSFENDVQGYINVVNGLVDGWRTEGVK